MQVQRNQIYNNYNTTFGIKVTPELKEMAHDFYCENNKSQKQFNRFYRKYKYMQEQYGLNNYTIVSKLFYLEGKPKYGLYAVNDDPSQKTITLAVKNSKRQILERFCHLNEFQIKEKIEKKNP